MRISFAGGGSDFKLFYKNGYGSVVSATINKYVYVIVNKRIDNLIRVGYSKTEFISDVNEIEHDIIRESLKFLKIDKALDITYIGDISIGNMGTGLGSSSALAVGVLNALYAYKNQTVSPEKLAQDACKIEIDILKRPIGKQDQYASAYGGLNFIKFNPDESVSVKSLKIKKEIREKLNSNLLMFNTGLNVQSSVVLNEQKNRIKNNYELLSGVVKLSQVLEKNLNKQNINDFGQILHRNWLLKKQFAAKVSNSIIDSYYNLALEAGASGGKILGSGGGGYLLFHCNSEKSKKQVKRALAGLEELNFKFAPVGSEIVYSD